MPIFESPYVDPVKGIGARSPQRNLLIPTSVKFSQPDGSVATFPGFVGTTGGQPWLAADADGDGIADSGLIRLPVGQINGLNYYAGIRIVDNNSAINVNTAWSRLFDFNNTYFVGKSPITGGYDDPGGAGIGGVLGYYRTNVGLLELLRTYKPVTYLAAPTGLAAPSGTASTSSEMDLLNTFRLGGAAALIQASPTFGC